MKWIAPSVGTMKCVFHTTKITVYDVFVRLDIQEHLAVSYIKKISLCHKLSVTSNSVITKNVDPVSPSVLRVLFATGHKTVRGLCVKNVSGLLHDCLDVIFIYNNINVLRSLFPKNLLKGGDVDPTIY